MRVDCWYGINGWTSNTATNSGPGNAYDRWPFTCVPYSSATTTDAMSLHRLTDFRDSSNLVLVFDGFYWLQQSIVNVNARHLNKTRTNLLFADGHADSAAASDLPADPETYRLGKFRFILRPEPGT